MKLVIDTVDHGLIISDPISKSKEEIANIIVEILNNQSCFKLKIKKKDKVIPYGVLNTSIIEIITE